MTTFAAFLFSMVGPLVIRALIALSFTAVVFTGVTDVVNSLVSYAQSSWATLPSTVLALVSLSGIPQVLGMIFGAYTARVAMWAALGATKYVFKAPT